MSKNDPAHVALSIRLPPKLHRELSRRALADRRSINNLVVLLLLEAVALRESA